MRILVKNEDGNGILEMIMFIPIALLIMFVGTDIGLSFVDKAMVQDAVRETVHSQLVSRSNEATSVYFARRGGVLINQEIASNLAVNLAQRVVNNISSRRISLKSGDLGSLVKARVSPVILNIDPNSGAVSNYSLGNTSEAGNQGLILDPKVSTQTPDSYLESVLSLNQSNDTYAVAAPLYNGGDLYLNQSLGFLVTVEAVCPSINPTLSQGVLGGAVGMQIHEFHVVRN